MIAANMPFFVRKDRLLLISRVPVKQLAGIDLPPAGVSDTVLFCPDNHYTLMIAVTVDIRPVMVIIGE